MKNYVIFHLRRRRDEKIDTFESWKPLSVVNFFEAQLMIDEDKDQEIGVYST